MPCFHAGQGQVQKRPRDGGIDAGGRFPGLDSVLKVAPGGLDDAKIIMKLSVAGRMPEGVRKHGLGFLVPASRMQGDAEPVKGVGVFRALVEDFAGQRLGVFRPAFRDQFTDCARVFCRRRSFAGQAMGPYSAALGSSALGGCRFTLPLECDSMKADVMLKTVSSRTWRPSSAWPVP